ncbi:hypothetical protein NMG60_11024880 [Bertholletia excelsa]
MEESSAILLVVFLSISCASEIKSDVKNHRFKAGDQVPFYANKVGPFHNPSETYSYYDLPFCSPDPVLAEKGTLGEVMNGDHLVSVPYKIDFLVEKDSEIACRKKLTTTQISKFRSAIAQDYYIQMYFDDLPIGKGNTIFFTHVVFDVFYNNEYVIEMHVRTIPQLTVELKQDKEVDVDFMYTVNWKETDTPFEKRMDKYHPRDLLIRWFSVINSCWTALILLGCMMMFYIRVLKKDINKYATDEELADNQEERGWKNIYGDVFRYPKYKSLFAASVGCGTQLFILVLCIIMLGLLGVFHPYGRGTLLTALVILYAITSVIAGYTAVSLYGQFEGTNWVRNLLLAGFLSIGPLFLTFCFLNSIAITYRTTVALSLGTILILFSLWLLGALPLPFLGGISARSSKSKFQAPCHTTRCPGEIPSLRWYRGIIPQTTVAGILPFSVIYIELNWLFANLLHHRIYTNYAILFIVIIMLVIVTAS